MIEKVCTKQNIEGEEREMEWIPNNFLFQNFPFSFFHLLISKGPETRKTELSSFSLKPHLTKQAVKHHSHCPAFPWHA